MFSLVSSSQAYIRAYNCVPLIVLISRPGVSSPQQCSYLGLCIDSLGELLSGPAELSSKQIS